MTNTTRQENTSRRESRGERATEPRLRTKEKESEAQEEEEEEEEKEDEEETENEEEEEEDAEKKGPRKLQYRNKRNTNRGTTKKEDPRRILGFVQLAVDLGKQDEQ